MITEEPESMSAPMQNKEAGKLRVQGLLACLSPLEFLLSFRSIMVHERRIANILNLISQNKNLSYKSKRWVEI